MGSRAKALGFEAPKRSSRFARADGLPEKPSQSTPKKGLGSKAWELCHLRWSPWFPEGVAFGQSGWHPTSPKQRRGPKGGGRGGSCPVAVCGGDGSRKETAHFERIRWRPTQKMGPKANPKPMRGPNSEAHGRLSRCGFLLPVGLGQWYLTTSAC